MTIERPMFPPPTRRDLLCVTAGAVALAVCPSAMAVTSPTAEADPAFALIAEKRAADVAHCEAIDVQDAADTAHNFEEYPELAELDERCLAACRAANEADWRLACTPPTTLAGVAAVLRFANEIEDAGMEWPCTDTIGAEGWHYQLRATMTAALEAIIRKGGV